MTITCQPMDATSGAPAYSAQNERQNMSVLYGGGSGVVLGARSGWRVGTPSNVLTVTSTQWTLAPCSAVINPGAATAQGAYRWSTDSNVTAANNLNAADATNTRIDIVYIKINDSSSGDGSGALSAPVLYAAGQPSASPVAPTLDPRSFLVGTITVPKVGGGAPTVVQNTAVFVAAGAPQPVFSVAERDALTKYDGLTVQRRDLDGRPNETWDGANWNGQVWTSYNPSFAGFSNLGTGAVQTGSYLMIAPKLCTVRAKLVAGTGGLLGTGNVAISLPFTSAADQVSIGQGEWLGTGTTGNIQNLFLSNPPSNIQASLLSPGSGSGISVTPGAAGYGYGAGTEVHCTITYRTA